MKTYLIFLFIGILLVGTAFAITLYVPSGCTYYIPSGQTGYIG